MPESLEACKKEALFEMYKTKYSLGLEMSEDEIDFLDSYSRIKRRGGSLESTENTGNVGRKYKVGD